MLKSTRHILCDPVEQKLESNYRLNTIQVNGTRKNGRRQKLPHDSLPHKPNCTELCSNGMLEHSKLFFEKLIANLASELAGNKLTKF